MTSNSVMNSVSYMPTIKKINAVWAKQAHQTLSALPYCRILHHIKSVSPKMRLLSSVSLYENIGSGSKIYNAP